VPEVKIAAEARTEFGKGAARRIRRGGKVPAVLYGHGTETRHLTLPGHDMMLALKTPNVLLRLEGLKSGSDLALPKAVQRDPIKGFLEHVDLILVLNQQLVQIPVEADATNIPQGIEVSVAGMEIGDAVHASDLRLPPGVTLQVEPDTMVLHVIAQQVAEEPEGEEAVEGAPEAPEALAETAAGSGQGSEEEQSG